MRTRHIVLLAALSLLTLCHDEESGRIWYVNNKAANASDTNPGTEAEPFKTINAASTNLLFQDGDTILVSPGTYNEGSAGSSTIKSRVFLTKRTILKSTGSTKDTFIVGERGPGSPSTTDSGVANSNVRCIYVDATANGSVIEGFTLCNGGTQYTSYTANSSGGGVYVAKSTDAYVVDCVISNCVATFGGGLHFGKAVRCHIVDCRAHGHSSSVGGGAAYGARLFNCVIERTRKNNGGKPGRLQGSHAVNCTFVNNFEGATTESNNEMRNCVVVGNELADYNSKITENCTTTSEQGKYQIASCEDGDFRLMAGSGGDSMECTANHWQTIGIDEKFVDKDFAGNTFPKTGTCLPGAVQAVARGVYVSADKGGLSCNEGWHEIADGDSLSITPVDCERPCVGFTFNGVPHYFDDGTKTFSSDAGVRVEAIYTNNWYVSADGSDDDANRGFTPKTAKPTFKALFESGKTFLAGDVVHVSEGVYSNGVMKVDNQTVGARMIVPAGVSVVADGEVEKTVIVGNPATEPDKDGLGPDAVRCVTLLANNSSVKGVTLTNGRTAKNGSGSSMKDNPENLGGGVYGPSGALVENCIISNNVAFRGGGATHVRLVNCKVIDNFGTDSTGSGSGIHYGSAYGCVFDHNKGHSTALYTSPICGCTFAPGNTSASAIYTTYALTLENNIIFGSSYLLKTTPIYSFFEKLPTVGTLGDGCVVTNAQSLQLDKNYQPVIGSNVAIDAGLADSSIPYISTYLKGLDLYGRQRVNNGVIDAGAVEADWRGVYARKLLKDRRFRVDSASTNVVAVLAEDGVRINDGQQLVAKWINRNAGMRRYEVKFRVVGSGTLTLTLNGEEFKFTAADGEVVKVFDNDISENEFKFDYVGESGAAGYAELLACNTSKGLWFCIQ